MGQQARDRIGRLEHVRVAEHRQRTRRRVLDEPHRGLGDDGERALAADQEARHVGAPLGQQLLEGVAGDLAREATHLGAHRGEVCRHESVEPVEEPR